MTGKTADSDIDGIAMECENIAYLLIKNGIWFFQVFFY